MCLLLFNSLISFPSPLFFFALSYLSSHTFIFTPLLQAFFCFFFVCSKLQVCWFHCVSLHLLHFQFKILVHWFLCSFDVSCNFAFNFFYVFRNLASRFLYTFVVLQISLYYDLITICILCLVCFSKQKVCDFAFAHVILLYCTTNKFSYFSQFTIDLHVFLVQFYIK